MDFQTRYQFNSKTDFLGKGGFSKVYKASDTLLERTVALKFFTGSAGDKYQILNEIRKVIRFEHPNLCKYYDVAVLSNKNVFGETDRIEVGIMEYIDSGNFKTYTRKHPEYIDKLLIDILKGLAYLHRHGIAHRDLKPQNILIKIVDDEPVSKITDFGISKLIDSDDDNSSMLLGTIEYMAPEQFNPRKYGINGRITTNLDLWSFGLLVYEALCHKSFFGSRSSGISAEQVMANILSDTSLEKADTLPTKYREIIKRCLVKNASERVKNALELLPLLEDKFTSSGNFRTTPKSDTSGVKPQVTHGIESQFVITEGAPQANHPPSLITSETQVFDVNPKAAEDETQFIEAEADINTIETQLVKSTPDTTEVTPNVEHIGRATTEERQVIEPEVDTTINETQAVESVTGTTEVTQIIDLITKAATEKTEIIELEATVTTNETQVGEATPDTTHVTQVVEAIPDTTNETQVIEATPDTTDVTLTIERFRGATKDETQLIESKADISTNEAQSALDTKEVIPNIEYVHDAPSDETQVIEPEVDTAINETQVFEFIPGTTEVTQTIDSTTETATDKAKVIEAEATAITNRTQVVESIPDTTDVTQNAERIWGATEDEIQVIEPAPPASIKETQAFESIPNTTKEVDVVDTIAELTPDPSTAETEVIDVISQTTEGKDVTKSNEETTADKTQVIQPGPPSATDKTKVIETIPENTEETEVSGYIPEATEGEVEHFEPVLNSHTDTAHMIEQTRVIDRVPEVITEETQVTEPVAGDTAAITQVVKPVSETRGDADEAMNDSRVESVLKRETIDRQSDSDAKETGREKSVQKSVKKVIVLSGAALLLIFLFIAYLSFDGPLARFDKNTNYSEKQRVNDTDLVKTGTVETSKDMADGEKSTPGNDSTGSVFKLSKNTIAVYFSTPKTFWINIDNVGGGKVINHIKMIKGSKQPIYLPVGKYRLRFESAMGGEIADSFLNVTNEMLKAPTLTFQPNFNKRAAKPVDNVGITSSDNAGVTPSNNSGINPSNNSGINPSNNSGINPSNNSGINPSNNSGINPSNNSGINPSNNSGINSLNNAGVNSSNNAGVSSSNNTINPPIPSLTEASATIKELSLQVVTVPGGSFTMGDSTRHIKSLRPRTVMINSIKFGKHEVTQQQWKEIMGYNNSGNQGCDNCPVENVSWNEVTSFISKINKMSINRFRLPTEAEWEYAARRAIRNEIENPGNKPPKQIETLLQQNVWYNENAEGKTHPVGKKKPLAEIYDLLGNVAEWCSEKVVKGGSFRDRKDDLKPILRNKENPARQENTIGFRLVMDTN